MYFVYFGIPFYVFCVFLCILCILCIWGTLLCILCICIFCILGFSGLVYMGRVICMGGGVGGCLLRFGKVCVEFVGVC